MARKINVSRDARFIPEWDGNNDLPYSEQLSVNYSCLSYEQRQKFIRKEKPKYILEDFDTKTDKEIDQEITAQHARVEIRVDTDDAGIHRAMAPMVVNLEDQDGNEISTWEQLLAIPQTAENKIASLIDEIIRELDSAARDKDLKN